MKFINVRELHIQTAGVLALVSKGEKIVVTNRGKPQAVISPFEKRDFEKWLSAYEPLIASESSLQKDWNRPEEDEAWKNL